MTLDGLDIEYTDAGAGFRCAVPTWKLDAALALRAAPAIESFGKPVTLAWGTDDKLFPLDHARRLRDAFPQSTLIEVPYSSAFVMLDAPEQLAAAIRNR
ncbi:MAG: hypothetical protein QOC76_4498 [Mycobacterium sp.]|nr:hypothetical protein [Mycobacterium sp.]